MNIQDSISYIRKTNLKIVQDQLEFTARMLHDAVNRLYHAGDPVRYRIGRNICRGILIPHRHSGNIVHHIAATCKSITVYLHVQSESGKIYPVSLDTIEPKEQKND